MRRILQTRRRFVQGLAGGAQQARFIGTASFFRQTWMACRFAQSMDRTGYARGTLAPRTGMSATIPVLDPRPTLTTVDVGMGMAQGAGGNMLGMDHAAMAELHRAATESSPIVDMQTQMAAIQRRRAAASRARERHDDDAPDSSSWHVERARRRARRVPGAQAYGHGATGSAHDVSRDGRLAWETGLPLPLAIPHGNRNASRGRRRAKRQRVAGSSLLIAVRTIVGLA